jgi:hypothetical protein
MPPITARVHEPTAVRMDQATEQCVRPPRDQLILPASEHDPAGVLLAGSMLGKEARPSFRIGVDLDAVFGAFLPRDLIVRAISTAFSPSEPSRSASATTATECIVGRLARCGWRDSNPQGLAPTAS